MCKTPEIACEVSLQPWQRYKMDAVIMFSDILLVPEAMGMKLTFRRDEGPKLSPILENGDDVSSLKTVDTKTSFDFVYDTIKLLKKKLPKDVPVIGFSGAPWTLACYMTGCVAAKLALPELMSRASSATTHKLLSKLADVVTNFVGLQQKAGADVIQLFDTWAGNLSRQDFKIFAAPYIKEIIEEGRKTAPFIIYSRKCSHILNELAGTGADIVSIDPDTSMKDAIKEIGDRTAIQGNLDPRLLTTTPGFVRQETSRLLSKIKGRNGHIINLGHGVLPASLLECVGAFVETVKSSA